MASGGFLVGVSTDVAWRLIGADFRIAFRIVVRFPLAARSSAVDGCQRSFSHTHNRTFYLIKLAVCVVGCARTVSAFSTDLSLLCAGQSCIGEIRFFHESYFAAALTCQGGGGRTVVRRGRFFLLKPNVSSVERSSSSSQLAFRKFGATRGTVMVKSNEIWCRPTWLGG